jgi:hypothetical protein
MTCGCGKKATWEVYSHLEGHCESCFLEATDCAEPQNVRLIDPWASVAVPVIDYRVITTCGRNFIWAAIDKQALVDEVYSKGYIIQTAQENSLYEAEIAAREAQEAFVAEHSTEIEGRYLKAI